MRSSTPSTSNSSLSGSSGFYSRTSNKPPLSPTSSSAPKNYQEWRAMMYDISYVSLRRPPNEIVNTILYYIAYNMKDAFDKEIQKLKNELNIIEPDVLKQVLTTKSRIKDPARRYFPNVTLFQLALWNFNADFWKPLLELLSPEDAEQQFKELENGLEYIELAQYGTNHEKKSSSHYDFGSLLTPLRDFVKQFPTRTHYGNQHFWCEKIGNAQLHTTASVVSKCYLENQELNSKDRAIWFNNNSGLGERFALYKGDEKAARPMGSNTLWWPNLILKQSELDLKALTAFYEAQTREWNNLQSKFRHSSTSSRHSCS